jgi:hypothetical protein
MTQFRRGPAPACDGMGLPQWFCRKMNTQRPPLVNVPAKNLD